MPLEPSAFTGTFSDKEEVFHDCCTVVLEKFEDSENILRQARNTLKVIDFKGQQCVVKAFRIPTFPQNFSYGLFANSKAKKSYYNAYKLLEMGFQTPQPVGYFERRSGGKLLESYYVCALANEAQTLDDLWSADRELELGLIADFAEYCIGLHKNGVLHRDFNPKNILVTNLEDQWQFSLVDINRISWSGPLSLERAMEGLSRLPFTKGIMQLLIQRYADSTGHDVEQCFSLLENEVSKTQRYFRNKQRLRKVFPRK